MNRQSFAILLNKYLNGECSDEEQQIVEQWYDLLEEIPDSKWNIKELEEKLSEYAVIEEDIADLSRYRQENESLRARITEATGMAAQDAMAMPWEDFEKIIKEKKTSATP